MGRNCGLIGYCDIVGGNCGLICHSVTVGGDCGPSCYSVGRNCGLIGLMKSFVVRNVTSLIKYFKGGAVCYIFVF